MSKNWNISNISVNNYLSPLYFALILGVGNYYKFSEPMHLAVISTIIYVLSSSFFQPDLDQHPEKPFASTFPVGSIGLDVMSALLKPIARTSKKAKFISYKLIAPINRAWFYFWAPYGILLTHRGVSHLPIIGVLTRIYYIKAMIMSMNILLLEVGYSPFINDGILDAFFFWENGIGEDFLVYCLPVYVSDFCHSAVDFMESKIKGYDFCPPAIPRGVISKTLSLVGIKITI